MLNYTITLLVFNKKYNFKNWVESRPLHKPIRWYIKWCVKCKILKKFCFYNFISYTRISNLNIFTELVDTDTYIVVHTNIISTCNILENENVFRFCNKNVRARMLVYYLCYYIFRFCWSFISEIHLFFFKLFMYVSR